MATQMQHGFYRREIAQPTELFTEKKKQQQSQALLHVLSLY